MICTTYFLTFFSELIPPTGIVILFLFLFCTTKIELQKVVTNSKFLSGHRQHLSVLQLKITN